MRFRIGKLWDAKSIASMHKVHSSNDFGVFSKLPRYFLVVYYYFLLQSPSSLVLVADNAGKICGFTSACLDAKEQKNYMFSKMKVAIYATVLLPAVICQPKLLSMIYLRAKTYFSGQGEADGYVSSEGARGEYWVWGDQKTSIYAGILNNKQLRILYELGVKTLLFEVDKNSKSFDFSVVNGAKVSRQVELPNGAVRIFMHYDLKERFRGKNDS